MQRTMKQKRQELSSSQRPQMHEVLPPPPPNRLVRPFSVGIIIEVVTLGALLVTLGSSQFSLYGYLLGLLAILTTLALITRGFWLMSRDEAQLRGKMWELEREQGKGQPPLAA